MIRVLVLSLLPISLSFVEPCLAVLQGAATAELFITRYTQSGDYAKLALWHEAAADCLKRISVPMNKIAHDYYVQHGYKKWTVRAKKEAQEIQAQHRFHRTRAEIARQKLVGTLCDPDILLQLDIESENIKKFITTWLPRYPNRFYEFGIYPTFFRKQRELAQQKGDYVKMLQLEADAAEMCATQYEKIPIAYGLKDYQKHQDAYRRQALRLRRIAQQKPQILPPEIDKGAQISDSLATQALSPQQKSDTVLEVAKLDTRVKAALTGQSNLHAYSTFHGFAWVITFSNHTRGNIAIAIVNDKTTEVLHVF